MKEITGKNYKVYYWWNGREISSTIIKASSRNAALKRFYRLCGYYEIARIMKFYPGVGWMEDRGL